MWLHFWFCIHFWFLRTELIIALWNVGRLFLLYYHTFLICASMLDNSPESRNLLAASSKVLMLLEETVVLWNFVEDTTLLPDWSCSFDTSEMKFIKPENLCILTDSTLQYIVFVVTSTNQIFHTKTFIAFFSFTNQIIADLPCCTLKSFSSRNICKWFEHANIFTLKSNVYCRYSDKYSLLNLINFCIHILRKHSKILKYSTFLIAKIQVVQFEKRNGEN